MLRTYGAPSLDGALFTLRCTPFAQEENAKIKAGEGEDLWNDKPRKKSQKDIDARWTEKNKQKNELFGVPLIKLYYFCT